MKQLFHVSNIAIALFAISIALLIFTFSLLMQIPGADTLYTPILATQALQNASTAKVMLVICGVILSIALTVHLLAGNSLNKQLFMLGTKPIKRPGEYAMLLQPIARRIMQNEENSERNIVNMKVLNAYISHEVKNTLNILSAMVFLQEAKADIIAYIRHISTSMEDILILSEVSGNKENTATDLALICAETVDEYRKSYPKIVFDLPEQSVSSVPGYENLYRRAIANLLDNAVKYGDGGAITVCIYERQQSVVVKVEDCGQGLNNVDIARLFEANYRMPKLKRDSHGIGLSLVKNVADLLRGAVWAENNANGGASFYFAVRSYQEGAGLGNA